MDDIRGGKCTDLLPHNAHEFFLQFLSVLVSFFQCHIRIKALALDVMFNPAEKYMQRQPSTRNDK